MYSFAAELWLYSGSKSAWHFVTLPPDLSDEIEERHGSAAAGFGSLPVEVTLGPTTWKTSIFPSKEAASYILPVKVAVREAAGVTAGDEVAVELSVRV